MNNTTQTESSRNIANLFMEYMLSGQSEALLDLFHDDGTWQLMGEAEGFPLARTYSKTEIPDLMQTIASAIATPIGMSIDSVMADGNKAAVQFHPMAHAVNGKTYDNHILFFFEIEAGKLRSLKEYLDTHHLKAIVS